jgi:hypothetical protein
VQRGGVGSGRRRRKGSWLAAVHFSGSHASVPGALSQLQILIDVRAMRPGNGLQTKKGRPGISLSRSVKNLATTEIWFYLSRTKINFTFCKDPTAAQVYWWDLSA